MFVLYTNEDSYFVEYLLGQLILSESINEAMVFDVLDNAKKCQTMLLKECDLLTSVNTFIK